MIHINRYLCLVVDFLSFIADNICTIVYRIIALPKYIVILHEFIVNVKF